MRTILLVVCFLTFSSSLVSQSSWANLKGLKVGQRIQVVEMNAKKHSGTFLSMSDSAITFSDAAGERSVQRQDVRRVNLQTKRRLRNTLIGTGAGAAVGAVAGAASAPSDGMFGGKDFAAAFVGTAFAVVGGTVGVLLPTHNTLYKVERR